eukprot:SAG31_NODE_13088_length_893_cov_1.609572_1_plen_38_part_01
MIEYGIHGALLPCTRLYTALKNFQVFFFIKKKTKQRST